VILCPYYHKSSEGRFSIEHYNFLSRRFDYPLSDNQDKRFKMAFNVGEGTSYVILFSVLGFFSLLAVASADYFRSCLPSWLNKQFVLRKDTGDGAPENGSMSADFFLSARDSASASQIAFSVFCSGMGAWIFYGPTEMGATPALSWIGLIGYSFASASPTLIAVVVGPMIKERCGDSSFNLTDFGRQRYGIVMQFVITLMSIFYMFIYLVAEMTSISLIYGKVGNSADLTFMTSIAISVGVITIAYTSFGGLPASIITDKFQALMVLILALILVVALTTNPANKIPEGNFALASNFTSEGTMAFVTLVIAIVSAEGFNLSTWQRVWAAKSVSDMKRGFVGGSIMIFMLMMFFGVMAMIAYSIDPASYDRSEKFAYLAFFDLLEPLEPAWHIVSLILVTSLATSTIDSLQNALMSPFSATLVKSGWNPKWIARAVIVLLNIPAVVLSAKQYNVINLFLVADLVCATSVLPIFLGLITEDKMGGLIPAPTEFGSLMGCISGVCTVLVMSVLVDSDDSLFEYFWLRNEGICSLCGSKTMITFIATPLSGGFFCLFFSKLDLLIRGNAARNPMFLLAGKADKAAYTEGVEKPVKMAPVKTAPVETTPAEQPLDTPREVGGYDSEVSMEV